MRSDEAKFLIVILTRGIDTMDGYEFSKNEIDSTKNIQIRYLFHSVFFVICSFRDEDEQDIEYEPVAVIEFQGTVSSQGNSNGHYICDIKDKLSNRWFRTNDNKIPMSITIESVSQAAYVILYKRST